MEVIIGRTMLGGVSHEGNVDLLNPQQQDFLSQILGRSNDPSQFNSMFQKSFVDPALQNLQQQIIPGLKESFNGLDESGSSALNRALAQSATDVATNLGYQQMNQYNQQQQQGLQGLQTRAFQPLLNQQQGILPGAINAFSSAVGGAVGSGGNPIGALMALIQSLSKGQGQIG